MPKHNQFGRKCVLTSNESAYGSKAARPWGKRGASIALAVPDRHPGPPIISMRKLDRGCGNTWSNNRFASSVPQTSFLPQRPLKRTLGRSHRVSPSTYIGNMFALRSKSPIADSPPPTHAGRSGTHLVRSALGACRPMAIREAASNPQCLEFIEIRRRRPWLVTWGGFERAEPVTPPWARAGAEPLRDTWGLHRHRVPTHRSSLRKGWRNGTTSSRLEQDAVQPPNRLSEIMAIARMSRQPFALREWSRRTSPIKRA